MRYQELLDFAPGLAEYTRQIPEELDGQFNLRSFGPHTIIHQKDWQLERIGILLEGTFRVVNELENGNVFMIEMNDPISFIGEVTLLAGSSTTSVTIETVTDCRIAFLPVPTFDAWLRQDIQLLRKVSEHVAFKLYRSSYSREERQFYSAKYVLLKYITQQAAHSEGKPLLIIPKTRQQISEEVGMTVKTVNRNVSKFCEDGIIGTHRGKIALTPAQLDSARQLMKVYLTQSKNGAP